MSEDFIHPYDTIFSSGLRFSSELIAWIAGPLAIAKFYGWFWVPFLLILVILPAIFSTEGDKRNVVVSTTGYLRVAIELLLYFVAAVSPWFVWSMIVSVACNLVVGASLVLGFPRLIWLLKGAENA